MEISAASSYVVKQTNTSTNIIIHIKKPVRGRTHGRRQSSWGPCVAWNKLYVIFRNDTRAKLSSVLSSSSSLLAGKLLPLRQKPRKRATRRKWIYIYIYIYIKHAESGVRRVKQHTHTHIIHTNWSSRKKRNPHWWLIKLGQVKVIRCQPTCICNTNTST